MLTKLSDIKLLIEAWVCGQFAGKVIWTNSDAPVPERPFITLALKTPKPLNRPYQAGANKQGVISRYTTQQFSITIHCYGEGANQSLFDLRESLDLLSVQKLLHASGASYLKDLMEVQDATSRTGTRYEERAVYEPAFIYKSVQSEEVGFIEEVKFEGDIHG
ncbi:MAG: hypothetical protein B6241_12450 [Spirochaetaceae bacterium 4572_59]|nr:MAG: hypothetical protein B6241_12450 [Spirochaetaceae bacterium 4572_59]